MLSPHIYKKIKKSTFYCSVIMACPNANFPAMLPLTAALPPSANNQLCYRRHCLQTTQAVRPNSLQLPTNFYATAFQSRLAGTPWIKPWSDIEVKKLARQGIQHLAVVCPSFVADCLETLEEVGMRLQDDFIHAGGKELTLIPCLNDSEAWVDALSDFLQKITATTTK